MNLLFTSPLANSPPLLTMVLFFYDWYFFIILVSRSCLLLIPISFLVSNTSFHLLFFVIALWREIKLSLIIPMSKSRFSEIWSMVPLNMFNGLCGVESQWGIAILNYCKSIKFHITFDFVTWIWYFAMEIF